MWKETYELLKRTFDGAPALLTDAMAIDLMKKLHNEGELKVSLNQGKGRGVLRIGNQRIELTLHDRDGERVKSISLFPDQEIRPEIGLYAADSGQRGGPGPAGGLHSYTPNIMLDVDFQGIGEDAEGS